MTLWNKNFLSLFQDLDPGTSGSFVVKNLPCNAGDACSIPGQGTKIPQTVKELSSLACPHALETTHHN